MKFAVLSYNVSRNFGDEIQSIAARRLLPQVDMTVSINGLTDFSHTEPVLLVMNGYFGNTAQFPPATCITPFYISFHISENAQQKFAPPPECISHFKQHQPIGCRDKGTMAFLQNLGIDAYYSGCLSLTFPLREKPGSCNLLVDVKTHRFQRKSYPYLKDSYIGVSHAHGIDILGDSSKCHIANQLLSQYQNAKQVVTSRLHCALPCAAMGVPVTYIGQLDRRTECLFELGETLNPPPLKWHYAISSKKLCQVTHFSQTKIQSIKKSLITTFNHRLNQLLKNQ